MIARLLGATCLALGTLLLGLLPSVYATALTTAVHANQRLCFHADADKAGEKIGVRDKLFQLYCKLQ